MSWHNDSSASSPLNTLEILEHLKANPSLLQSSGSESDASSSGHSHTKRKLAATAAAAGGIAIGVKAIHSYRNRSRSRSSSPEPSSRAKNIGKKVAIGAGVATLALGAGVAGTAAYIQHKRKERKKKCGDKGPFVAKLVGRKYGKLDPGDPFGLRRHDQHLGQTLHASSHAALGADRQHSTQPEQDTSHHGWGTAAVGATGVAAAGGLLYSHYSRSSSQQQEQYQEHSRSHSNPPHPPLYHQSDPFSASPSPQFLGQINQSSPSDPFGNSSSHSHFASYMGEIPGSIISPIGVSSGDGSGGGYTSNPFGAQHFGDPRDRGGSDRREEDHLSYRVHTSLNICDDTNNNNPSREARDFEYGSRSRPYLSPSSVFVFSSTSAEASGTIAPSIFGDDNCDCGCGGEVGQKRQQQQQQTPLGGDIDIFTLVNGPTSAGERNGMETTMPSMSGFCGRNGGDTFPRSVWVETCSSGSSMVY